MSTRKSSGEVTAPAIGPMLGEVEAASLAALIVQETNRANDSMPDYVKNALMSTAVTLAEYGKLVGSATSETNALMGRITSPDASPAK